MNTKIKLIVVMVGLLLAGGANAACSQADTAALEKLDRDWGAASQAGDRKALEALYADAYLDLAPGALSDRKAAVETAIAEAEARKAAGKPVPPVTHDNYLINCTGQSAMITHRNWGPMGEGADAGTWQTRSVHHLEKIGGQWKVVSNATHPITDEARLIYLDLEWNQADLAADKAWFERNLADDYIGVSGRDGALEDKTALLAEVGTSRITSAVTTDIESQVDGDRGMVTGVYHTKGTDKDGKAFTAKHRYIDVFVKRDGRWQIWSSQGTEVKD
ncbi:MAG TPA: nuclear transport factor 2 family protein [Gammaproteobacteria bacterium]|nr:nuclear transport factor 2 family protein [Gammaproteobacteria bacterium]